MNKRIRTNRLHRYILASGLVMVSFGIWISCSKNTGVSSIDPTSTDDGVSSQRLVGTKPAVGGSNYADFHPQTGVNYDPFAGMTRSQRKEALGGLEGSVKHLQVVAHHVALAMRDSTARELLHSVVPKDKQGDVHLFQTMMDNPAFFGLVSEGFKDAVSNKGIDANLSAIIRDTPSNGEAFLKASKALVDVVLTLVVPPGEEWNPDDIIPVFSAPVDDKPGSVMEGVNTDLNPTFLTLQKGDPPYTFLFLNFDENSPMIREGTSLSLGPELSPIERLWASWQNTVQSISLTTPANAHIQGSGVVHFSHDTLVAPLNAIEILDYDEPWGGGPPDVYLDIKIRLLQYGEHYHEQRFYLPLVTETHHIYTEYRDIRTQHGLRHEWNYNRIKQIRVMDEDWGADDHMGKWVDTHMYQLPSHIQWLGPGNSVNENDARIQVIKYGE